MNNLLQTCQRYMEGISYASFMLLVFLLPFPWDFAQPVLIVWLIAWALEFRWLKRPDLRDGVKPLVPLLLIAVWVVWEALSLLWTGDKAAGWSEVNKHLPLLAIVVIGIFGVNDFYKPIQIKKCLMVGCLVSTACYLMVVYWLLRVGKLDKLQDSWFWTMLGSPHLQIFKHRFYYAFPMLLAIGFSVDLFEEYRQKYSTLSAALTVGVADLVLIAAIFLTGSRTMMLVLPLLALVLFLLYYQGRYCWGIVGAIIASSVAFLLFGFRYQPRMIELKEEVSNQVENVNPHKREPRTYIWKAAMDGVSDYGVWGLGVGSADAYLLKKYEVRKANESFYVELLNKQYGPHNQYLKEWMELGPIAMLLLLFIVVGSPFFLKGAVRRDTIILGMLFGIGLFTETILGRMSGIFIVCTMLVLVIAEGWHKDSLPPVHP